MSKEEALIQFYNDNRHLPPQGSQEWLDLKILKVGGSQISNIINIKTGKILFGGINGVIKSKLGVIDFHGSIHTLIGNLMEKVVIKILEERIFLTKIYEFGSIQSYEQNFSYSPDGILYLKSIDMIILIEIKNPTRRRANGKIPMHYKAQIYSGLDTIKLADMALFIDTMFRRCTIEDWVFNEKYDTALHDKPNELPILDKPIMLCKLMIYQKDPEVATYLNIDAGSCSTYYLYILINAMINGELLYKIYYFYEGDEITYDYDEFIEENKYTHLTVLPFKLFRFDLVQVQRDEWKHNEPFLSYLSKYINYIIETVIRLKKIQPGDELDNMIKTLPTILPPPDS